MTIAHRLGTISNCDSIIVLNSGRITERGSHAELLALEGEYKAMWDAQARNSEAEEVKEEPSEAEAEPQVDARRPLKHSFVGWLCFSLLLWSARAAPSVAFCYFLVARQVTPDKFADLSSVVIAAGVRPGRTTRPARLANSGQEGPDDLDAASRLNDCEYQNSANSLP